MIGKNLLVESNTRQTLRELDTIIEYYHESIRQHLQKLEKILKLEFRSNFQTNIKFSVYLSLLILREVMPIRHIWTAFSTGTRNQSYISTIAEETNVNVKAKHVFQHQERNILHLVRFERDNLLGTVR